MRSSNIARAVRNTPALTAEAVAAAVGLRPRDLAKALNTLGFRGRCDRAATELYTNGTVARRVQATQSRWCPPQSMHLAARDRSPTVQQNVHGPPGWSTTRPPTQQHPTAARRAIAAAVNTDDGEHKIDALEHRSCPQAIIVACAADRDWFTRCWIAGSATSPPSALAALACDPDGVIDTAENPSCPPAVLVALMLSEDPEIQHTAACNPNTPVSGFEALARVDRHALRRLAANSSPRVRSAAETALRTTRAQLDSPCP